MQLIKFTIPSCLHASNHSIESVYLFILLLFEVPILLISKRKKIVDDLFEIMLSQNTRVCIDSRQITFLSCFCAWLNELNFRNYLDEQKIKIKVLARELIAILFIISYFHFFCCGIKNLIYCSYLCSSFCMCIKKSSVEHNRYEKKCRVISGKGINSKTHVKA